MSQSNTLDISWEAIIKVFVAIFIFYIIYLARSIALWFFFALAISILLDPAINVFRKIKIPRIIAILIVYLSIFGILGLFIYISAPLFISEIKQFIQYLPGYFEQINPILRQFGIDTAQNINDLSNIVTSNLQQSSQSNYKAIMVFFGGFDFYCFDFDNGIFSFFRREGYEKGLVLLAPQKYEDILK